LNTKHLLLPVRTEKLRLGLMILLIVFWAMSFAAVPIYTLFEKPAWDVVIYLHGVDSIRAGHDPYSDAIAIQQAFHQTKALHPDAQVPYSYVYSPITLPILHLVAITPLWLSGLFYWLLYAACLLAQAWGGLQLANAKERRVFLFFAPIAGFFPGLLANDNLWSGNIAYVLYGTIILCAFIGWRRGNWNWFYLAVVAASCVKAPLLSLLVIAPLSAPRQWLRTSLAASAGLFLFAAQPVLWPSLFSHYLQAVELQFSYNRDFGSSPAGLFSGYLFDHNIPYSPACYFFFLGYAIPLFALLVYLSRQYFRGRFTLSQWLPVLLVGVILLNPRILEYDEILLALPLALIAWRFFACLAPTRWAIVLTVTTFLTANCIAYQSWSIWKLTEGPLLVVFFSAGCWTLLQARRQVSGSADEPILPQPELQPARPA
jgi:hypothetical protein